MRCCPVWKVGLMLAPETINGCATKSRMGKTIAAAMSMNLKSSVKKFSLLFCGMDVLYAVRYSSQYEMDDCRTWQSKCRICKYSAQCRQGFCRVSCQKNIFSQGGGLERVYEQFRTGDQKINMKRQKFDCRTR